MVETAKRNRAIQQPKRCLTCKSLKKKGIAKSRGESRKTLRGNGVRGLGGKTQGKNSLYKSRSEGGKIGEGASYSNTGALTTLDILDTRRTYDHRRPGVREERSVRPDHVKILIGKKKG